MSERPLYIEIKPRKTGEYEITNAAWRPESKGIS